MKHPGNNPENLLNSDGLRALVESGIVRVTASEPLSDEDLDKFIHTELDDLEEDDLENLLDKTEALLADMDEKEPPEDDEEKHDLWEDQVSELEAFHDRILDRLGDLEDEE